MSQENVEVVRRMNRAFNEGDVEGVVDVFHPDAELTDLLNAPDLPRSARGTTGIREVVATWFDAFDEFSGEVTEYIDAGDAVICVTHYRGKGKESGLTVDYDGVDLHEFRNGKVTRTTLGYASKADALQAAGL